MAKKKKERIEFRFYEVPQKEPLLALLGTTWNRPYGKEYNCHQNHFHNLMEIGFCYCGRGMMVMDDEEIFYHGGAFTVIPKNLGHVTVSEGETLNQWEYLFIDVEHVLGKFYPQDPIFVDRLAEKVNAGWLFFYEDTNSLAAGLIRNILTIMTKREDMYQESVNGLLLSLFIEIAKMNAPEEVKRSIHEIGATQIAPALEYVGRFFKSPLRIEDLADVCHISETHFRRLFGESMHMTPVEYINLVRIQMACEMMNSSHDNVGDIAIKVGFDTPSTFNRNFKKVVGMSPCEWKRSRENYEGKLLNYHITAYKGW